MHGHTRDSDGRHRPSSPSPAIRAGIWRCAMPRAPRQLPSLPPPNRANPTAGANSGLDKTWGQGQSCCRLHCLPGALGGGVRNGMTAALLVVTSVAVYGVDAIRRAVGRTAGFPSRIRDPDSARFAIPQASLGVTSCILNVMWRRASFFYQPTSWRCSDRTTQSSGTTMQCWW